MTRNEIKRALAQMDELSAYGLRLFLDNRATVLAYEWHLEDAEGQEGAEDSADGLLRVVTRGRQALIAISRIVLIEAVPPPAP